MTTLASRVPVFTGAAGAAVRVGASGCVSAMAVFVACLVTVSEKDIIMMRGRRANAFCRPLRQWEKRAILGQVEYFGISFFIVA